MYAFLQKNTGRTISAQLQIDPANSDKTTLTSGKMSVNTKISCTNIIR